MQNHVHSGEGACGRILLLSVQCDRGACGGTYFQKQRAGTAGRVVYGCGGTGLCLTDADELRHNAADLSGRVELTLALATLGGEVPHEVFVSITEDVVPLGAVLGKVEGRVLEDCDQIG